VNRRLITAELLRLRRNRALVIWAFILTTGAVTAFFLIAQGFHWNDSAHNGPAGGADNLRHPLMILSLVGGVAAAIVGTSVGVSDLSSGVFRDLVVTGKSRLVLFAARVPGMLLLWIPLVLLAFGVAVAFDFGFAGNLATPTLTQLVKDGLWLVMVDSIALIVAMGVSSLIGSRGISIGVLLAWQLAVTPLVLNISQLGVTRELLLSAATGRVQPFTGGRDNQLSMSLVAAVVVLVGWVVVPLLLGGWRTVTRQA
jgi:ABC-type transport system involved in multi-copper enzyme maturation permease subunit